MSGDKSLANGQSEPASPDVVLTHDARVQEWVLSTREIWACCEAMAKVQDLHDVQAELFFAEQEAHNLIQIGIGSLRSFPALILPIARSRADWARSPEI